MTIEAHFLPATQQALFRCLLDAMTRPGTVHEAADLIERGELYRAVLAVLVDGAVTLGDASGSLPQSDWPFLEAREVTPEQADFVLCDGARGPDFEPRVGDLPNPERGATLVLRVARVGEGPLRLQLSGPGVEHRRELAVSGLVPAWIEARRGWNAAFPLGVDWILADSERLVALPRTTRVVHMKEEIA
ncbi:phosphonate C-P lyase system protein PhnH [Methylococcus sp. ANG]|uniref:phosphonate C-P lyase system protein PhnH n=1 Tax=Methylococcus sp. ANG TaxID=3231903 RepID=UPI003457CDFC